MKDESKLIIVCGVVQGVGFRPFVSRTATMCQIRGTVANKGSYVEIYATGTKMNLRIFIAQIKTNPPPRAAILSLEVTDTKLRSDTEFQIIESEHEEGDIFVSPDIATCEECKKELFDPNNRRYLHPFINCTACGPRVTILDSMPYDRERTSMGEFPMCSECSYEYTHEQTRRYDAQPVCCNDCGPEVYLMGTNLKGSKAIIAARKMISEGKIIAIKGIGGFHLCCDALNESAVNRLREKKHRPAKPFAVMMKDMDTVNRECMVSKPEVEVLDGHQKPILLLRKRKQGYLSETIAPGNPKVGVMLPYAPIQMLLFDYPDELTSFTDCFVMTSGNVSGAPICRTDEDAESEIKDFCDGILSHNRKIRLRADDSVMDFYDNKPYMIRRSRGYAPLPFLLGKPYQKMVLAVGGELKNTFCIGKRQLFYPSPYVGDMADIRTVNALKESIQRMQTLLEAAPKVVACDLHPKYNTTVIAQEMKLPLLMVQHHFAHIVSCMAENNYLKKVIGVAFDGTGYGTDHTIWGGEILACTPDSFERMGSIDPFLQIGQDLSAKEGFRIAVSYINRLFPQNAAQICKNLELCEENIRVLYEKMAQKKMNSVVSTSAGRLFDAVSAILGLTKVSSFEGEAAMKLQFAARKSKKAKEFSDSFIKEYPLIHYNESMMLMSTDELVKSVIQLRLQGEKSSDISYYFHDVLSQMIIKACIVARDRIAVNTAALSGGVFQNLLLLRFCVAGLKKEKFQVLTHSLVPPNDGGISLGQAVIAMEQLEKGGILSCV